MRMNITLVLLTAVLVAAPVFAQQSRPAAGCTATPAQVEANKKVAMEFFKPGISVEQRTALIDEGYVQHNPVFKKFADDKKIGYYEGFKQMMAQNMAAGRGGAPGAGQGGPQPPQGNPLEIVMAECDLVTIIHKNFRQDPTAAAGTWYEVFTFDVFRIRNGKLFEHWDGAVINPPAPSSSSGRGAQE